MDNNVLKHRINPYLYGRRNYFDFGASLHKAWGNENLSNWSGGLIGGAASLVGAGVNKLIAGNFQSGAGSKIASIGSNIGNLVSTVNPLIGGAVTLGSNIIGGLTSRLTGFSQNAQQAAFEQNIKDTLGRANSFQANAGDYTGLAALYGEAPTMSYIQTSDIGKDGVWGHTMKNRAAGYNDKRAASNAFVQNQLSANKEAIMAANNLGLDRNYQTFGGDLHTHGTVFPTGLVHVNAGSTHELNPNGGVPMGVDAQGTPNVVEEGETIWNNDYVFSAKKDGKGGLVIPKDYRKKHKIPDSVKSYADLSKFLTKESEERPNDTISKRGAEEALAQAAQMQEEARAIKQQEDQQKYADNVRRKFNQFSPEEQQEIVQLAQQLQQESMASQQQLPMMSAFGGPINKFVYGGSSAGEPSYVSAGRRKADTPVYDNKQIVGTILELGKRSLVDWDKEKIQAEEGIKKVPVPHRAHLASGVNPGLDRLPTPEEAQASLLRQSIDKDRLPPYIPTEKSGFDLSYLRYAPVFSGMYNVIADELGLRNKPDYTMADMILNSAKNQPSPTLAYEPIRGGMDTMTLDPLVNQEAIRQSMAAVDRAALNTSAGNRAVAAAQLMSNSSLAADKGSQAYLNDIKMQQELNRQAFAANTDIMKHNSNMFQQAFSEYQRLKAANSDYSLKARIEAARLRDTADQSASAAYSADWTNLVNSIRDIGNEEFNRNMVNSNAAEYYGVSRTGKNYYKGQAPLPTDERYQDWKAELNRQYRDRLLKGN